MDDFRTVQWNSSRPDFHLKIDFFKFMYRSNSLLEIAEWPKCYSDEFENIFMCLICFFFLFLFFVFFLLSQKTVLFKIYFKSSIFWKQHSSSEIWDCQWHKTFSVTPVFTALILFLFQIIKKYQCCGFTFTNFLFLLTTTNALATSLVTSQTRILVFFQFFDLTFPK